MDTKTILILTVTAGGGHLQAAKAKHAEVKSAHPECVVIQQDILFDWVWKYFGLFAKHIWGDAQVKGNVFILCLLAFGMRITNFIFFYPFYRSAYAIIKKYNVDKIIDTQPLATASVIKAIRRYEKESGKIIPYEKVITDLPTEEAKHFFSGIKSLKKEYRPYLKVLTTVPILEEGETEESFWKKNCNLGFYSKET